MSSEFTNFMTRQLYMQPPIQSSYNIPPSLVKMSDYDKIIEQFSTPPPPQTIDFLFSIFGSEHDPRYRITIQQILTHRTNPLNNSTEFYVKLVGKSYSNCVWVSEEFILMNGFFTKLKEYKKINEQPKKYPYYDPEYEKIEKIIGRRNGNEYLVKWCNLEYEQSTWETRETIKNDELISKFNKSQILPTSKELQIPPKPNPTQWKCIKEKPHSKTGLLARDYQVEGLNFLTNCWYHNRNCILADEMGLGKTLQSILFLDYLHNQEKIRGPFLIVVPLSTITQWTRELIEWSSFNPLVFIGDQVRRTIMKAFEFYYENTKIPKFDVLLTTFDNILRDNELASIYWQCIIIDEAHRLKNSESKLLKIFKSYKASFKILLTGTPIQNKTQELWSLLNFLDPSKFNSLSDFEQQFGNCNEMKAVHEIQTILRPIMLRRLKSDVEKGIAPLEEVIIDCPMTMHQKAYYKAIFMKNLAYLTRGAHSKTNSSCLRNISMDLRKVCNHPYLLKKAEEQILIERREAMKDIDPNEYTFVNESLIRSSGKMILLDKLLTKLKSDGHRVLIFSQMQRMLDILTDYLNYKKYQFERIDGSIRSKDRQMAIDKFNEPNSKDFVFLLCTKAGGVGINLTSADTVIIYDSDWNPQNDIQATARCHRIGQTKEVKAYRFITADSYERKMFETASMKLGLDKAVLETSKIHNPEDMDKLIRLGAYHALEDDNCEIEQFGEEDIENIISRSQRIKYENIKGESTFSKAEFKIEEESVPVALYKPEFWKKYVPKEDMSPYMQYDDDYSDNSSSKERKNNNHLDMLDYVFDSDEEDNQLHSDPEYWNKERIQLLIHQLVRLGFNNWDKIINNIKLNCDENEIKAVSHVILSWILLNSEEDSILQDLYNEMINKYTLQFEKIFNKKKKNELKSILLEEDKWRSKRIEVLYCIDRLVKTCPSVPNGIIVPEVDKGIPTSWWEKKHDQQLLYYVSQNGIQQLGKITFDNHQEESIPKKVLLNRLNLIASNLIEIYKQYKNHHKNEDVFISHEMFTKAVSYWSPKDQKTVIRFLCLFGYPDAEKFKFISGLRDKTEISIDLFVKEIMNYCQTVQSKSKSQNSTTDDQTNEYDESTDAADYPIIEQSNYIVEPITKSKALQILSRCKFFEKVRELVKIKSDLSETEKNLIEYVAERGFLNPDESQAIRNVFGSATPTETKVIKRIENIDRAFFGKKTLKTNPSSLSPKSGSLFDSDSTQNDSEQQQEMKLMPSTSYSISEKFSFQTDSKGNPIMPISLSQSLIIVSLGKIVYGRPNFHTKRYIYTDGFISDHFYSSVINPKEKVWYRSLILDKGKEGPVFRVEMKDNRSVFFEGNSPSTPWLTVFRKVNERRGANQKSSVAVSGPEFYGLSNPIIHFLIRNLPNAEKCDSNDYPRIGKLKYKKLNDQVETTDTKEEEEDDEDDEKDRQQKSIEKLDQQEIFEKEIEKVEEKFKQQKSLKKEQNLNTKRKKKDDKEIDEDLDKYKEKKTEILKPARKKKTRKQKVEENSDFSLNFQNQTSEIDEPEFDESNKIKFNAQYPLILDFPKLIIKAKAMGREEDEIFEIYGY